jgi:phosphoenolpyruvate---glycerone phosphotransferase subunit DhaL
MTTTPSTISLDDFRSAFVAGANHICDSRDELCALDAAAGDGDLGATLAAGFTAVREAVAEAELHDAGDLLRRVGSELARKAPSTIGALFASAFLQAASELAGTTELDTSDVARFLRASAYGVAERGHAERGQRTVLDAMYTAAEEAEHAAAERLPPAGALQQAAAGAHAGAAATADMEPRHGRAGWIADRARGHPDAGATAWAVFLTGLAGALSDHTSANGT